MNEFDHASHAAFHGRGWIERRGDQEGDVRGGRVWASFGCDSEWSRLEAVLLHRPGPAIGELTDPNAALHLRPIDGRRLQAQHARIVECYRSLDIEVHTLGALPVDDRRHPNACFVRDLFWQTPEGAVISRMASPVRAGEEAYAAAALAALRVPIALTVGGAGTLEGADCLWTGPTTVLCGIGARTNRSGLEQLRRWLEPRGVRCLAVRVPPRVQHLLGCVQIVAAERALVRTGAAPAGLVRTLEQEGFTVLAVPEDPEVVERFAFNFVVIGPNRIVMGDDSPEFRNFLEREGIEVAGVAPYSEYVNAAGGLACATGILSRERVSPPRESS